MRLTIHNKVLITLCLVVFTGLFSLQFASYRLSGQNMNNMIKSDMIDARKNIDLFLKQYFLVYDLELNDTTLKYESENITKELSTEFGNSIEIYGHNGRLSSAMTTPYYFKDDEGISKALNNETSYSTYYLNKRLLVSLTFPIKKDTNILGAIRYIGDYTDLYSNNERFKSITNLFAVIIFGMTLVTSFFLSKIITKPIRALTRNSEQISKGNFNLSINVHSKDEVGELAERFKIMVERIKNQIEYIEKERDHLKTVQQQNKAFFDNVSHEMKTPLTTILGYAQVIQENGFTDEEFFQKGISYIISESERLNKLIVDVLEISKSSSAEFSYEFRNFNLSRLIENTCDEMLIKCQKYNIDIHCSTENDLFIYGDENRIKEVLINIIDNSLKYGDTNSTVEVLAYRDQGKIYVSIKDTGSGIPPEAAEQVFNPFFKLKEKSREKGSIGLGLFITKKIMEKHDGRISINSNYKEGTEVILEFKVKEDE